MENYDELVARLHANAGTGISAKAIACREAAYAIENLLNQLEQALTERDAAVRDLARYNDCVTCNQHCGGCSFELVAPEPCEYGWQWRGLEGK